MTRAILAGLTLVLLVNPSVWAHRLQLRARTKLDPPIVWIDVFYDDGTLASEAKIQLLNADGMIFAEGVTDDQGQWNLPRPSEGNYRIRVDAGAGHRTEGVLSIANEAESEKTPSVEEMTRYPWQRVAMGLTTLAVLASLYLLVRRGCSSCGQFR